jgi:hypothetical protein
VKTLRAIVEGLFAYVVIVGIAIAVVGGCVLLVEQLPIDKWWEVGVVGVDLPSPE